MTDVGCSRVTPQMALRPSSYCAATIATVARGAGFNGRAANLKAELKLSAEPVVAKKPAGNRG